MPDLRPLSEKALTAAIRGYGGRPLTREADLFLTTLAAQCLVERLWWSGIVLAKPATAEQPAELGL